MASRRIRMTRMLVALLCLGLLAQHAAADEARALMPLDRPTAGAALARLAADSDAQAVSEPEKSADPQASKPFLKTKRGILLVSLVALAVGFTLYSKSNDRVQSPIR